MEQGVIARWLKQPGDLVAAGDVLAEIETDKAVMEMEAVDNGVLDRIVVMDGGEASVGEVIAILVDSGEASICHAAPPALEAQKMLLDRIAETEPDVTGKERIFASPLARRIAAAADIHLGTLTASGSSGRIVRRDVEIANAYPASVPEMIVAQPSEILGERSRVVPEASDSVATTRTHLLVGDAAPTTIYLEMDCAFDRALSLRNELNAAASPDATGLPRFRLTITDFVVKAFASALAENPEANVAWANGELRRCNTIDVGVAIAIPGGTVVPIVRQADMLSLSRLSSNIVAFRTDALEKSLRQTDLDGGSGTVANLGSLGVKRFMAVPFHPHTTLLAVGATRTQLALVDGSLGTECQLPITLCIDGRALDGVCASRLLATFRALVESPISLLA